MPSATFPLPVSLFSRDLVQTCSGALEEAWLALGPDRTELLLPTEVARLAMASGIVVAATIGIRDQRRLTRAALDALDQATARCLPKLQPVDGETPAALRQPSAYRERAEELRTVADDAKSDEVKRYFAAMCVDYERMARSVELIEMSRKAIDNLPPYRR